MNELKNDGNEVKVINEQILLGKEFKIYGDYENPLFLAKDVAEWINYDLSSIHKMINSVDSSEKVRKNVPTLGGNQEMWFLTEDGLYEVLMLSRKPFAKEFKKQVKEILRSIRKNGMYAKDELLDNPDLLIEVANRLKAERELRLAAERQIELNRPKVMLADALALSNSTILIGELAKLLKQNGVDIGQNRLFDWLRKKGYLINRKGNDYNMPTQKSMDLKILNIKETPIYHGDGHMTITKTPKVTVKGQQYFIEKFMSEVR